MSGIVTAHKTLRLVLEQTSFDDYHDAVRSRDPVRLATVAYPLERAFEVVINFVIELVALGLKELGLEPIDGPRDLEAFATAGVIPKRLAQELTDIHRARNDLQHDYPDVRAKQIYPASEKVVKILPTFLRRYATWLRGLGYGVPGV